MNAVALVANLTIMQALNACISIGEDAYNSAPFSHALLGIYASLIDAARDAFLDADYKGQTLILDVVEALDMLEDSLGWDDHDGRLVVAWAARDAAAHLGIDVPKAATLGDAVIF